MLFSNGIRQTVAVLLRGRGNKPYPPPRRDMAAPAAALLFCVIWSCSAAAADNSARTPADSSAASLPPDVKYVGLHADLAFPRSFDTGLGVGLRVKRPVLQDTFSIVSEVNYWGASRDSLDITVFGVEGSFLHRYDLSRDWDGFGGLTVGYHYTNKKTTTNRQGYEQVLDSHEGNVGIFVTSGLEYTYRTGRTLYMQFKYGWFNKDLEYHIVGGMYFPVYRLDKVGDD